MTELVLCGHACPFPGGEPCPLEHGHAGIHVYWTQTKPHAKRGRNGVWIVDANGNTLMHATFEGAASAEDICALLALQDAVHRRMDERQSSPVPRPGQPPTGEAV